jgi:haloacetate dehalogenase
MFKDFIKKFVKVKKGKVFCRIGGKGPPLLLLHGYPQTHLMWHKTAHKLAENFTVIAADLRGYGASFVLPGDKKHLNYSKREMAKDMVQMMNKLSFKKFFIAGHDRGGRVAHRLARDHGKKVIAMSVLDICPTLDMYEQTTKEFAKAYFHWFFLIQPKWLPEKIIKIDPRKWMKSCLDKWSGNRKFGKVEQEYLKSFKKIKRIHASCEDYRASATIDLEHDKKDRKKLLNIPIQVLWGKNSVIGKQFKPLKNWQNYTRKKITGSSMKSGHFIPEENPKETVIKLKKFFFAHIQNLL